MSYTSLRTKAHKNLCKVKQILESSPTKPLALGNVRHAVAVLMHSKVAHVTEQDDIRVLTLSVQADTAYSIVVYHHWCTLSRLVALHLSHQHTTPQVRCNKFMYSEVMLFFKVSESMGQRKDIYILFCLEFSIFFILIIKNI